jgi:hypothetical protein
MSTRLPSMRRGSTAGSAFAEPSFNGVLGEAKGSSVRTSVQDVAANVSDEIVMIADRAIAKRKEFERVDMINNLRTFGIDSELSSACETGGGSAKEIAFPVNCFFL